MKRTMATFLAVALVASLCPSAALAAQGGGSSLVAASLAVQASAMDESEPNDDFDHATKIKMNMAVYGECDAAFGKWDTNDEDFFKITLPQSGSIKITFANDKYEKSTYESDSLYLYVYNKYHEEAGRYSYSMHTTRPISNTISLSKGTNWVRVYRSIYNNKHHPYHFKLTYNIPTTTVTKVTAAKKAFTAKWTKKSGAAEYQLRYSANKSMSKAKTVNVSKKYGSKMITKLKAKKKYWVQVRVAKKIGGVTYWSPWSGRKAVTTKK